MKSFKSSSLIQERLKPRFMRTSRRISKPRVSRQHQLLIENPFRQGDQQNILPSNLKNQLQNIDYLSNNQIQGITFTTVGQRRSSTFARHLQAMQNAAKKQEDMYQFFMGCNIQKKEGSQTEIMQQQRPMTIEQNDNLSTRMNQYFFMMDTDPMDHQPLNFFSQEEQADNIIFYSQNDIQVETPGEDFQAYFDV